MSGRRYKNTHYTCFPATKNNNNACVDKYFNKSITQHLALAWSLHLLCRTVCTSPGGSLGFRLAYRNCRNAAISDYGLRSREDCLGFHEVKPQCVISPSQQQWQEPSPTGLTLKRTKILSISQVKLQG